MTASVAVNLHDLAPELDDADIQARAWAMAKGVADSLPDRIVLLHAAAMLKAMLAVNQNDPILAVTQMLQEHSVSALEMTHHALELMGQPANTQH